ncbi:MAG TPA: hypothetical protein PK245_02145 [Clostridia bacterium]|nr:hypothetical protein [Clostridia bacterium]
MVKLTKKAWIELAVGVAVFGALITVAAFLDLKSTKRCISRVAFTASSSPTSAKRPPT